MSTVHQVDEVHFSEEELLDFEESINKLEAGKVGAVDGVFKILIPDSERGTPVEEALRLIVKNNIKVSRQVVVRGKGMNIHHYTKVNTSPSKFAAKAKNISSYSEETCCSHHLNVSPDALLSHFFQDVIDNGPSIRDSIRGSFDPAEKECTLLKNAAHIKRHYENLKKGCIPVLPQAEISSCSCLDCYDELESETDESIKFQGNCEEAILYGDGITLKRSDPPILITQNFGLSRIISILNLLKVSYEGLHSPYYYIGSRHSFFPLHIEDASLWSINHLITGQPKIWIVIPPNALMLLDYHLRWSGLSTSNTSCNNILLHKTVLPTPVWLRDRGVPFKVIIQKPGECVVLYPTAAHFGFNTGWNLAEAINFATVSWIPFGLNAPRCLCLENQIHLDLSDIVAAFRPDVLGSYLRAEPIPTPNFEEMTQMLMLFVKNRSVPIESSQKRKSHSQHKEENEPCTSSTVRREVKCPALFCKKKYPSAKMGRLINHINNKHRPIKDKLLIKINQKQQLQDTEELV